jgi:hypothetical protein
MALVTEDGTGLLTAESYLSVTDADTYWSNRGNATWAAALTADKEEALRRSTQFLDATFRWVGKISTTEQALGWPRYSAFDHEGRLLSEQVPTLLEMACAELALEGLTAELLVTVSRNDRVSRVKAGSVEVEFEHGISSQKAFDLASRILAPLFTSRVGGSSIQLVKA